MKMLRVASLALAAAFVALPVSADPIPLARISDYLNGLDTASARFTQNNADGSVSAGTLYINRPGRMRFEYDPPNAALVMAGGGQVAVFDPKSNQPPEQYPLKRTPLNLILEPQVNLGRANMVVGHSGDETRTIVVAQDPENPDYGTIALVFGGAPLALQQWVIVDDTGGQTIVTLDALEQGVRLSPTLFNINMETSSRLGRN
ncbi:LolA family protein [Actibacterium sp. XHP0104]|uniref:LolA family protein n=1 Tax=Actibacterium sp. XHP0104 TaxID=2984335 RepID=UPI0021E70E62|nr:outer membrane lipoprotein carrier protein LolA [Actibacterium sp. XHP0104]MCV2881952.1 outer membrane lipoprotein carrier protein LolA [Actibacterium sp. XHP0104]